MTGHRSPEKATGNPVGNERGSTTRILLLVLLLVVAAAGYLYYFTDLIRPVKEAAKPAPVQTAQVKKPIPPRPEQPGGEAVPAKPGEAKPPQGGAPAAPVAKPAAEQKPAPPAAAPAKVAKAEAPAPPAPAAKPAPPAPAKPAPPVTAKPAPPVTAKPAPPAPAKPAPPVAAAKPAPAPKIEAAPATPVRKAEKPAVKRKGGAYALLVGDFVPDMTFATVQAKLKKSGISPIRKRDLSAAEPMNRLFVAEFTDQDAAEAELQKVKKLTADAFLVADNGRYSLYAGSYFTEGRTASELKRLAARGIKPVVRKARITIKVTRVTAGSYASAEDARKDAQRLKKLGITAKVVKAGS